MSGTWAVGHNYCKDMCPSRPIVSRMRGAVPHWPMTYDVVPTNLLTIGP